MPISTIIINQAGGFGWFISDGKKRYLRKDGSIGPSTLDHNQEYAYWDTEQEAKDFLTEQQKND